MILSHHSQTRTSDWSNSTGNLSPVVPVLSVTQDISREIYRFNAYRDRQNRTFGQTSTAWRFDKTGRQWLTQQALWALLNWLNASMPTQSAYNDRELSKNMLMQLGSVTAIKRGYVQMILASLTEDWKTMKLLRQGLENKELAHRIIDLDPFSLGYRSDLNRIIGSIGLIRSHAHEETRGEEIVTPIELEFNKLLAWLDVLRSVSTSQWKADQVIRLWLIGLTVRSIREKTGIDQLIPVSQV